jgi:hypothetical protein
MVSRKLPQLLLLVCAITALAGFGSRKPAALRVCEEVPDRFEFQIDAVILELSSGRRIASVTKQRESVTPVAETERKRWIKWAEKKITEAQNAMDLAETDPRLRASSKELTQVSKHLVDFHGYAQKGNLKRMLDALENVRQHGRKAGKTACTPL